MRETDATDCGVVLQKEKGERWAGLQYRKRWVNQLEGSAAPQRHGSTLGWRANADDGLACFPRNPPMEATKRPMWIRAVAVPSRVQPDRGQLEPNCFPPQSSQRRPTRATLLPPAAIRIIVMPAVLCSSRRHGRSCKMMRSTVIGPVLFVGHWAEK